MSISLFYNFFNFHQLKMCIRDRLSLILFIGGQTVGGIVFLVLAFLVSPFGVPAIAEWLVDKLHSAKFTLRDFITG